MKCVVNNMEEMIEQLKKWVNDRYCFKKCGWDFTDALDEYESCFSYGQDSQQSIDAYEIGMIIGMDLEEPEKSIYE